jgi:hypothetical protein
MKQKHGVWIFMFVFSEQVFVKVLFVVGHHVQLLQARFGISCQGIFARVYHERVQNQGDKVPQQIVDAGGNGRNVLNFKDRNLFVLEKGERDHMFCSLAAVFQDFCDRIIVLVFNEHYFGDNENIRIQMEKKVVQKGIKLSNHRFTVSVMFM